MTNILHDKTSKALTAMSIPISMGMLSTFLFQIVDTYFVGKLGPDALAALSFSSTVFFLLVGLFMGLSVGVSIIIGQAIGAKDNTKVYKTLNLGLMISFVLSTILSGALIIFIEPLFAALGANPTVLPLVIEYTVPLLMGIPLLTLGLLLGASLRASGNIVKPEIIMGIAGVINVVFDYGLIFGKLGLPELGLKGAAYATVLSWVFIIVGMILLGLKDKIVKLKTTSSHSTQSILIEIQQLSTPTIVTQIISPLTLMYLTFLLARESSMSVAAFGIAGRIEILLMIGILAVSNAITPFIAQNQGAQQKSRIEEAIVYGGKSATYIGILIAILLYIFIKPIAGIFSDSLEVISYTANYFYIVSLSYVLYGLFIMTTAIFNGLKLTQKSLKMSLVKSFVFTVPLTFIGSLWSVQGIFIGLAIGNVLAGIYASYEMRKAERNTNSKLADVNIWKEYLKDFKRLFNRIK